MSFVLYKGIEWRRVLTVRSELDGSLVDLTGRDVVVQLRRRSGSAVLVDATVTLKEQSGATLGQCDVVIEAADTTSLEVASHVVSALVDDQVVVAPLKLSVRAL